MIGNSKGKVTRPVIENKTVSVGAAVRGRGKPVATGAGKPSSLGSKVDEISLLDYAKLGMTEYGTYVIENRALTDLRDGLKPVQRRILWTMFKAGLMSNAKPKKSARTVGDTMGMYHPHGDKSIYDAMVGMAGVRPRGKKDQWLRKNSNEATIEGTGNFGDHVSNAAAMRYTEAKLSQYAERFLLDRDYLAVTPMARNYSDDMDEPVVLPAKIPNLLVNGSEGIAVGVAAGIPSFELEAVRDCAVRAIEGTLNKAFMFKRLKNSFSFAYGGQAVYDENTESELKSLITNGYGRIDFQPFWKSEGRDFIITSSAPRLGWKTLREKLRNVAGTAKVIDETGDDGIRIVVQPLKNLATPKQLEIWRGRLLQQIQTSVSYNVAATIRNSEKDIQFKELSLLDVFQEWAAWRIDLEKRVIQYKQGNTERELMRVETMILAINNLSVVLKALQADDTEAVLKKKLKATDEQVEIIMEMKVRQLKSLELAPQEKKAKELRAAISKLKADFKNPVPRINDELKALKA